MARLNKEQALQLQDEAWNMHLQGLSNAEIATVQRVHVNTVANRLAAKRQRLYEEYRNKTSEMREVELVEYLDFVLKNSALQVALAGEDEKLLRTRFLDIIIKAVNSKFNIQSTTGSINSRPKEVHGTFVLSDGKDAMAMTLSELRARQRQLLREMDLLDVDVRMLSDGSLKEGAGGG